MSGIGLIIVILVFAALCCARAGSIGGALVTGALAVLLFVSTPAGSSLPSKITDLMQGVNNSTTPHLTGGDNGAHQARQR